MSFFKRIPIVATAFKSGDLFSMLKVNSARDRFEDNLSHYLHSKYVFTVNSGTSAFYLILKVLSSLYPSKKEVILPAYTASSLLLPIKRLGLKVVLCDISLETFNLDIENLSNLISQNTLSVVPVHLFGLACDTDSIKKAIKQRYRETVIIEDCAQALGTCIANKPVGCQGDISLFSFNRGKNMSTCYGGLICTNNQRLAELLKKELNLLKAPSIFNKLRIIIELILLSLVVRPFIYSSLYPLLKAFKSESPPVNFSVLNYTDIQAAVGLSLLKKLHYFSQIRYRNGSSLYDSLRNKKEVRLAAILNSSKPAYNRFPVLFRDIALKERIKKALFKEGIDSSEMYERPLHFIFDLAYKKGDLPNAEYFAKRLLTLPCHPLVTGSTLKLIREIFKQNL